MSIRGVCPPSTAIPSSKEKALEEENTTLREQNAALVEALRFWSDLVVNSSGVSGWHQNGEIAPWGYWQDKIDATNDMIRTESAEAGNNG
jgi:hypothetical protein